MTLERQTEISDPQSYTAPKFGTYADASLKQVRASGSKSGDATMLPPITDAFKEAKLKQRSEEHGKVIKTEGPGQAAEQAKAANTTDHKVTKGENLWKIARESMTVEGQPLPRAKDIQKQVQDIVNLNKEHYQTLTKNPNHIEAGWTLKMPPKAEAPKKDGPNPPVDDKAPKKDGPNSPVDDKAPKKDGPNPPVDDKAPKKDGPNPPVDDKAPKKDGPLPPADPPRDYKLESLSRAAADLSHNDAMDYIDRYDDSWYRPGFAMGGDGKVSKGAIESFLKDYGKPGDTAYSAEVINQAKVLRDNWDHPWLNSFKDSSGALDVEKVRNVAKPTGPAQN